MSINVFLKIFILSLRLFLNYCWVTQDVNSHDHLSKIKIIIIIIIIINIIIIIIKIFKEGSPSAAAVFQEALHLNT